MNKLRLNHFILIAGVMIIALFTSGTKVMAETYTVTVTDESEALQANLDAVDANATSIQLVMQQDKEATYKWPSEISTITIGENTTLNLTASELATGKYKYDPTTGAITLFAGDVNGNIAITATAVAKSDDVSLTSLKYTVQGESQSDDIQTSVVAGEPYAITLEKYITTGQTLTLDYGVKEGATAEATSGTFAVKDDATVTEATASVVVTAENGTQATYTIVATSALPKLTGNVTIETPTLSKRAKTFGDAVADLNAQELTGSADTEAGLVSFPLTWSIPEGGTTDETVFGESENNLAWTAAVGEAGYLLNDQTVTGTATIANIAASTDATLATLTFEAFNGEASLGEASPVSGFIDTDAEPTKAYTQAVPFNTTSIKIVATLKHAGATVGEGQLEQTISFPGTTTATINVTAEDGEAKHDVTITFKQAQEKILTVGELVIPEFTKLLDAEDLKTELDQIVLPITTDGDTKELATEWTLKGETFNAGSGAENTYTWAATVPEGLDKTGEGIDAKLSGTKIITNYITPKTGNLNNVAISDKSNTVIGDGTTETTAGTITVNADVPVVINNATVTKIDVTANVKSIEIKKGSVETITVEASASGLAIKVANDLAAGSIQTVTIASDAVVTLKNDEVAKAMLMPRSMMRSTLTNSGAVAAVENNGTFTDETATIVTVTGTGTNALAITELPSNAELKDGKAILTVAAEDANFQWQDAMGEALDDAEDATFTATAVGQYRCKVVKGTTTLYTPYVTVSEAQTSVEPGVTTYTVTLPAVEGATFSKGTTTSVDEGADFSFTITLSKDYDQSVPVVKVGDEAITADADGVYTIKNITKDITISVTGIQKNVVTGIEEIASGSKVYGAKGEIVIDLSASMRVKVISLSGAPIYSGEINGMKHIQANAGIYLISLSDGQMKVTEKVVVR